MGQGAAVGVEHHQVNGGGLARDARPAFGFQTDVKVAFPHHDGRVPVGSVAARVGHGSPHGELLVAALQGDGRLHGDDRVPLGVGGGFAALGRLLGRLGARCAAREVKVPCPGGGLLEGVVGPGFRRAEGVRLHFHVVVHRRVGHCVAGIVSGGEVHCGAAARHERRHVGREVHFKDRLVVKGYPHAAPADGVAFGLEADGPGVGAGRGFLGQQHRAVESAQRREGQALLTDDFAFVRKANPYGCGFGQGVMQVVVASHQALEEDFLTGAVEGAVGVDEGGGVVEAGVSRVPVGSGQGLLEVGRAPVRIGEGEAVGGVHEGEAGRVGQVGPGSHAVGVGGDDARVAQRGGIVFDIGGEKAHRQVGLGRACLEVGGPHQSVGRAGLQGEVVGGNQQPVGVIALVLAGWRFVQNEAIRAGGQGLAAVEGAQRELQGVEGVGGGCGNGFRLPRAYQRVGGGAVVVPCQGVHQRGVAGDGIQAKRGAFQVGVTEPDGLWAVGAHHRGVRGQHQAGARLQVRCGDAEGVSLLQGVAEKVGQAGQQGNGVSGARLQPLEEKAAVESLNFERGWAG